MNAETGKREKLYAEEAKNMDELLQMILASIALPGYHPSVKIGDKFYRDGDLVWMTNHRVKFLMERGFSLDQIVAVECFDNSKDTQSELAGIMENIDSNDLHKVCFESLREAKELPEPKILIKPPKNLFKISN